MDCITLQDAHDTRVTVHKVWPKKGTDYGLWYARCSVHAPDSRPYTGRVLYSCWEQGGLLELESTLPAAVLRDLSETVYDALWLAWLRAYRMVDRTTAETPQSEGPALW